MSASFNLVLDTTGPQAPTISIAGGAVYTNTTSVTVTFGTSDSPTTGYEMKVWGADIGIAAEPAGWESFSTSKSVTLTGADGTKTVYARFRDDVGNETAIISDSITLDTTLPVVTVGTPSTSKISKVDGFRAATNTFQSDSEFDEYQVRVVPSTGSTVTAGTLIPTTNGSVNTSGAAGGYPAVTNTTVTIDGADLEAASAGDGTKIIKVFVRDVAGNWSV